MQKILALVVLLVFPLFVHGQYYKDMANWREGFKRSLLKGDLALKPEDTAWLRFYPINEAYRVHANFVQIAGGKPFLMQTMHDGTRPAVQVYGYVYFNLMGASIKLYVYRFMGNDGADDQLFIPFTDRTNYKETFPGGRYLDLSVNDVINDKVIIDFNKCYNPHTAYEKGFPYIIPPRANSLRIEIKAGEKIFGRNPGY